jgi:hypothetical protein
MAVITNVNVGLVSNQSGTVGGTGTVTPVAKSYAYDEAQYTQTDPINLQLGGQSSWAAGTSTANTGGASAYASFCAFTNKQVRSITYVPTVAETALEFVQIDLYSMQPQTFGTATGTLCYNAASLGAGTQGYLGTIMGTGVNRVRICGIIGAGGTGIGGATGTQAFGVGTAVAYNPTYVNLAGATATIIVVSPAGTNTQAGYVFPTGALGGLTMFPGDVLTFTRGTGTLGVALLEVEATFSPGGNVTR